MTEDASPKHVASENTNAKPRVTGPVERHAPLATGIALAIPTLLAHYLPMSDLPMHESVIGILRHYGDASYFPPDLYRLNFGHPNQLFHVVAWALSYLVGTTWACKIVVAITQVLILVVGARLADYLGRSRWSALLFAPLALGFTYYWGLVANLIGFVAFFGALPMIDRVGRAPTARSLLKLCGVFVLLFFAHESVFVIAAGFAGMVAIAHPLDRLTPKRFVPVLFGLAVVGGHFYYSARFFPRSKVEMPALFPPIWDKMYFLPADLFGSHDGDARVMLFGLGTTAIIALLVGRLRSKEQLPPLPRPLLSRLQAILLHYRFEATAVVFLLGVALFPQSWNTATLLHARFIGPAWALFAITAAPRVDPPRIAKFAAVVMPLGILLLSWPQFVDSDHTYRDMDSLIAQIPKNSAVALAAIDRPAVRTRVYSASTGAARVVADRGGRTSLSLTPSPISPVQMNPAYRWDELDRRLLLSSSRALKPSHDLKRFGYVLAQSRDPVVREIIVIAFKPDAELVAIQGEWILLRSTHPQRALTSPDFPPPPGQKTILERVMYLLAVKDEIDKQRLPPSALNAAPSGGQVAPPPADASAPESGATPPALPTPVTDRPSSVP